MTRTGHAGLAQVARRGYAHVMRRRTRGCAWGLVCGVFAAGCFGDSTTMEPPGRVEIPTPTPVPTGGMVAAGAGGMGMAGSPPPLPVPDAGMPDTGAPDTGTPDAGMPIDTSGAGETGRLVGMTAAHNAVRARMHNPMPSPPLPPMKWSTEIAAIAQAYADSCPMGHSMRPGFGENLAFFGGFMSNPMMVVESWAGEEACYTFGPFFQGDNCDMFCTSAMSSNGCGHYTQIVWRDSIEVGCGVGTCFGGQEIWVCNYRVQGNFVGMPAY